VNCETNNQGWTRHPDKLVPMQGISLGERHASLFPFVRCRGIESREASGPMPSNGGKHDGGVRSRCRPAGWVELLYSECALGDLRRERKN
jgi:hypothetical protein